jgi:hypothetical protein
MGVENYQFIENLEYDVDSIFNKFRKATFCLNWSFVKNKQNYFEQQRPKFGKRNCASSPHLLKL